MIEVKGNRITNSKTNFKTVNDHEFNVFPGLVELSLADNSFILFPDAPLFAVMMGNNEIYKDGSFNDSYLNKFVVSREDIDSTKYSYNRIGLLSIDVIKIPKKEIARLYTMTSEDAIIYRLYVE